MRSLVRRDISTPSATVEKKVAKNMKSDAESVFENHTNPVVQSAKQYRERRRLSSRTPPQRHGKRSRPSEEMTEAGCGAGPLLASLSGAFSSCSIL